MKYVFFGTPKFAGTVLQKLIDKGLPPVLAVCNPDRPTGRTQELTAPPVKQTAEAYGIPFFQPEKLGNGEIARIKSVGAEFGVLAAYGKIIPAELISAFPRGIIGVHPSLLPLYRGASPIQSTILDGAEETGVTLFLMDEKVDHGPVLAQERLSNYRKETAEYPILHDMLANLSGELAAKTIPQFTGGALSQIAQDERRATYTQKFTADDAHVASEDLARAQTEGGKIAGTIDRKIRALNPEPGVWTTEKDGKRMKLLASEIREGALRLLLIQREGKNPQPFVS